MFQFETSASSNERAAPINSFGHSGSKPWQLIPSATRLS
eukprot:gene24918-10571_t